MMFGVKRKKKILKDVQSEVQTEAACHAEVVKISEGVKVVTAKNSFTRKLWFWLKKRRLKKKRIKKAKINSYLSKVGTESHKNKAEQERIKHNEWFYRL
jgi:hypothetical protein